MTSLWQDVRFGARMLLKNPGVSALAVATLALAIGANTAIFSIVNAVLLRPLPFKNPDRLVSLWAKVPEHGRWRTTPANFFDWKKQNTVFEDLAAFGSWTMTLTGHGEPEQLLGTQVSSGYFSVVGVEPMLGRSFLPEEYQPGKGQAVILGHAFWQRRYGGNQNLINSPITLNGVPYLVVGVMPPGIYPARPTTTGTISFEQSEEQFWTPMSFSPQWAAVRTAHVLGAVARLKPNVAVAQAQAEMDTIGGRLAHEYAVDKDEGIIVSPFMNEVAGDVKPALVMLFSAVLIVLLIACANIAGLLLSQHSARTKEISIRAALGARRARLVRQFLIESLLLSLIGSAAGIAVAKFALGTMVAIIPANIPRLDQAHLDLRVLGFTLALSVLTCLIFGLAPAWKAVSHDLQPTLDQGGRGSRPTFARQRLRQALVVFQVSTAATLVIGAGLLSMSFWRLHQVDPGFNPDHVITFSLTLPPSKYGDNARVNGFYNQLVERLSGVPGVLAAAIGYDHPLQTNWVDSFSVEGRPETEERLSANFNAVGWDYFHTVGAQIIEGRDFTAQDDQNHPGVTIVNEAFARRYFPDERALNRRLQLSAPARIWRNQRLHSFEIIGIARNVKSAGLKAETEPTYYVPATQAPLNDMLVLIRTRGDPNALVPTLRKAVWEIDPDQPIADVKTMNKIVSDSVGQPRLNMTLMASFGALALILAAVGIYGLLSYAVTQRTQELGIRMALGAQVRDVLMLVLKQGMTLALIGEGIGLIEALIFTRLLRGLLFGVTPTNATIFIAVFQVLTVVSLMACYVPARRATKVDPLQALRYE
jgi:putative ABC transport system permease protein